MTTIFRSDKTLTAPRTGTLLLPDLGISGITHRWSAEAAVGALDGQVTSVTDSAGTRHLTTRLGSVILRQAPNGKRYLDLGAGAAAFNAMSTGPENTVETWDTYTLVALFYLGAEQSASSIGLVGTNSGSYNAGGLITRGKLAQLYGGSGGGTLNSGYTARPEIGWHTAVATYSKTGQDTVAIDGSGIVTGEVHPATPLAVNRFALAAPPTLLARVADTAYVNRALTNAEIAAVHTKLMASVPA